MLIIYNLFCLGFAGENKTVPRILFARQCFSLASSNRNVNVVNTHLWTLLLRYVVSATPSASSDNCTIEIPIRSGITTRHSVCSEPISIVTLELTTDLFCLVHRLDHRAAYSICFLEVLQNYSVSKPIWIRLYDSTTNRTVTIGGYDSLQHPGSSTQHYRDSWFDCVPIMTNVLHNLNLADYIVR